MDIKSKHSDFVDRRVPEPSGLSRIRNYLRSYAEKLLFRSFGYEQFELRLEDSEGRYARASLDEARSRLFSELSHEFQTPIAILKGNIEILKSSSLRDKKPLYVMENTVDRLSRLVQGSLDALRRGSQMDSWKKENVSIESLFSEIHDDCSVFFEDKAVTFTFASDSFFVSVNRDRLKEVILNLVSNALKHVRPGGLVALTGRVVDRSAEVVVADTGDGIAPENIPHIFERFYRIDPLGTGLGLHICRQIIESYAGTIRVESKVGEGTRFIIRLPLTPSSS